MEGLAGILALGKPLLGLPRMAKLKPGEVREPLTSPKHSELTLAPMIGCGYPHQDGLPREERAPDRLAIPVPEWFASDAAIDRAHESLPENPGIGVVEPNDHRGSRPQQLPYCTIVAVCNPGLDNGSVGHETAKFRGGLRLPVRPPMQRVELNTWARRRFGQRTSERAFSGAACANNHEPQMFLRRDHAS